MNQIIVAGQKNIPQIIAIRLEVSLKLPPLLQFIIWISHRSVKLQHFDLSNKHSGAPAVKHEEK
jgi:hypothetical protein